MGKKIITVFALLLTAMPCFCWGFFAHRKINQYAVYLLPPEMMVFFKPHIGFLEEHAVDPDKRRYAVPWEAPRHYIDMDHYTGAKGDELPRKWELAVAKYSEDTLNAYGIVPWWLQTMLYRLTAAFKEKDPAKILKYAAELGHYTGDAHVPLHATRNHNGQYTDQKGIHGFWESRIPELLAETGWDFFIGKAGYIESPQEFIWERVLESAAAADTVLDVERELTRNFPVDQKFSYEERNGLVIRQYSSAFCKKYDALLKGMIERRMRQSIYATASFWYTAWVNAGQPDLAGLVNKEFSNKDRLEFDSLNSAWKKGVPLGREE